MTAKPLDPVKEESSHDSGEENKLKDVDLMNENEIRDEMLNNHGLLPIGNKMFISSTIKQKFEATEMRNIPLKPASGKSLLFEPRTSKVLDYPNTFNASKSSVVQYKDAQSSFDWPFGHQNSLLTPP